MCGGWTVTWQGHGIEHHPELCKTLAEAIGERFGHRNVEVIPGVSYDAHESRYDTERRDRFDEAAEAARRADVVVLCLGENSYCEKPGDLNDLALDPLQTELAERIAATGKPVVLVLSEGRPRLISKFSARIPAIVQSYLPGPQGADAVADVLMGKVSCKFRKIGVNDQFGQSGKAADVLREYGLTADQIADRIRETL